MTAMLMMGTALLGMMHPPGMRTPRHASPHVSRHIAPNMLRQNYDLVVIGGGPVGVTAALRGAALGYTTILIDATPPRQFQFTGPTGLFSKALRDSALRLDIGTLRSMGIADVAIWAQVNDFVQQILRKSGENNMQALSLNRVPHLRGVGRLTGKFAAGRKRYEEEMGEGAYGVEGACEVEVTFTGGGRAEGDKVALSTDNVLLATGSKALRLATLERWYSEAVGGHVRCHDSDSIKRLSFLPRSVVVVGGVRAPASNPAALRTKTKSAARACLRPSCCCPAC
jgi:NAD(P) transhydrogenase